MKGREIDMMLKWWKEKRGKFREKNRSDLMRKLHDRAY
jgi:hypothetical protein